MLCAASWMRMLQYERAMAFGKGSALRILRRGVSRLRRNVLIRRSQRAQVGIDSLLCGCAS
jgi:hypothetical protein